MMRILYKFIFGLLYLLSLLPLRVLYVVSDFFYLLVYHVVGYRKRLVRRHLAESFPEKSETQRRAIERGFYSWFYDYLVETIKLLSISKRQMMRHMRFTGVDKVNEAIERGQSVEIGRAHV